MQEDFIRFIRHCRSGYESGLHTQKRTSGGGGGCNFYGGQARLYVHQGGLRNHIQGERNGYGHFHSGGQDHGSRAHGGGNRDQIRNMVFM